MTFQDTETDESVKHIGLLNFVENRQEDNDLIVEEHKDAGSGNGGAGLLLPEAKINGGVPPLDSNSDMDADSPEGSQRDFRNRKARGRSQTISEKKSPSKDVLRMRKLPKLVSF